MKKEDLKVGMLLEMEENGKTGLCLVGCREDGILNWSGDGIWGDFKCLNDDLTYNLWCEGGKILKVYGRPKYNKDSHLLSTTDRKLLWERDHEPQVGDVYKGTGTNQFVILDINDARYYRLFDDGSCGCYTRNHLDNYEFTGRNIKEYVQDLFDEIEV